MISRDWVYNEVRGTALWITLNRLDATNFLNDPVADGLAAGLDVAAAGNALLCITIRAEGRAAFAEKRKPNFTGR